MRSADIQISLGDYFAPAQGGARYTSAKVAAVMDALARHGARGIGQSSWGPTGFAFAESDDEARRLVKLVRENSAQANPVMLICKGINHGARIATIHRAARRRTGTSLMAKLILHMLSPLKHMSPFDVNMALDAGYDAVIPYTSVTLDEVMPLVQDAMFSRPPRDAVRTAIFIGGKDAILALDMIDKARGALLKPFEISIFADPAGSFTTAAAMVACVEKILKEKKNRSLAGTKVIILGATGVVGFCSGVIAALEGAKVVLAGHDGPARVEKGASEIKKRFGVDVGFIDASTPEKKLAGLVASEVVLCAGRAGVQIFSADEIKKAPGLLVAADVNAVPPYGIEGLDLHDNGKELPGGSLGIGALAIGNVKYQTESKLFQKMAVSQEALCLDFRDAFKLARELV